jgi:hypothetical protein
MWRKGVGSIGSGVVSGTSSDSGAETGALGGFHNKTVGMWRK